MNSTARTQFWSGRRVAITGATGFVGWHLVCALKRCGARVQALVRPSSNLDRLNNSAIPCVIAPLDDVSALVHGCRDCEFLFHCAGAVDFNDHWSAVWKANVSGTANVVTAARKSKVRRVIHTSSIVAVGATLRAQIFDEAHPWTLRRLRVPYVTTKRIAEERALGSNDSALQVIAVNPTCVVGPEDFTGSEFGVLCQRFWKRRIPFHFHGGNNFVDVRDVAWGHILAAEKGVPGQRYILGGVNRTYASFFRDLARVSSRSIFRVQVPWIVGPLLTAIDNRQRRRKARRPYLTDAQLRIMPYFFFASSGRAQRDLGYAPRPFSQTLRDAYAFWMPKQPA